MPPKRKKTKRAPIQPKGAAAAGSGAEPVKSAAAFETAKAALNVAEANAAKSMISVEHWRAVCVAKAKAMQTSMDATIAAAPQKERDALQAAEKDHRSALLSAEKAMACRRLAIGMSETAEEMMKNACDHKVTYQVCSSGQDEYTWDVCDACGLRLN